MTPPPGGGPGPTGPARRLRRLLAPLDAAFDRLFGPRFNPLYQSGNLAFFTFLVALVTGIYLFLFYSIDSPYDSVTRIDRDLLGGSLIRSVHRYSADLALVAAAVHLIRKLAHGHTWGPRALAWRSGILLIGVFLACGWTGLVMMWDEQGRLLAVEGARLLDLLPVLSEPIGRSFNGAAAVPSSFFFMNLFLHVALPLGVLGLFWLHVSRIARPALLPPRPVMLWVGALLVGVSLTVPVPILPAADLLAAPATVRIDWFYAFWLPFASRSPAWVHLVAWIGLAAILWSVPRWWRPRSARIRASTVREDLCAGCYQCYQDCPYDAITMVPRQVPSSLSEVVARVNPDLCVACGICSGSCAPMGVGPPGRTGRDQLAAMRAFLDARPPGPETVVLFACAYGLGAHPSLSELPGVVAYPTGCAGSVHTSVLELALRRGAGGVFLLTCPPRDCLNREGPKWLEERLYHDREAELQDRVDKRRLTTAAVAVGQSTAARRELEAFRARIAALDVDPPEATVDLERECATAPEVESVGA